jgi:hypothetical protein
MDPPRVDIAGPVAGEGTKEVLDEKAEVVSKLNSPSLDMRLDQVAETNT